MATVPSRSIQGCHWFDHLIGKRFTYIVQYPKILLDRALFTVTPEVVHFQREMQVPEHEVG